MAMLVQHVLAVLWGLTFGGYVLGVLAVVFLHSITGSSGAPTETGGMIWLRRLIDRE